MHYIKERDNIVCNGKYTSIQTNLLPNKFLNCEEQIKTQINLITEKIGTNIQFTKNKILQYKVQDK